MYQQHSSTYKRAPVPPQHPEREIQRKKVENEKDGHFSTPVKRERASINYINQTPTKSQALAHPPGWERITWAPKVCRKAVRRFDFGEISTAAH